MVESICIQDVSGWGVVGVGCRIAGHGGILVLCLINKERKLRRKEGSREGREEGREEEEEGADCLSLILPTRVTLIPVHNPSALSDITGHRLRLGIDACFSMIEPNAMISSHKPPIH
jgi:hypothetical protein